MPPETVAIARNLACAWAAGSLIGAERGYNGRAAGFRTHALVALAAAAAVVVAFDPSATTADFLAGRSRIAQGVVTGVGFLGAGVIFKEGVSIQGLTTAACVWATAAIGLLFGMGMIGPGALVTAAVLVTLVGFRFVESNLPQRVFALATFRFASAQAPSEAGLLELIGRDRYSLFDISSALGQGGEIVEYRGNLRAVGKGALTDLGERLRRLPGVVEFDLARINK